MVGSLSPPKSAFDAKRERDVFSLHAAFQDIPYIESLGASPDTHSIPSDYVPKPASDASLAAFCQLAAMRLNAARSLISLIDDKYQYILAEATPKTSLRADSPLNKENDLGFGHVRLPRRWGVCERVLDPAALTEEDKGIVIINDFTKSEQHSKRSYVRDGPLRFYAGVPLVTESGSVVGAVCILDHMVREGLSKDDILYLQDLAVTIMEYLVTYTIKDRYRRAAEGLNGLMSFAEDASASTATDFSTREHVSTTENRPEQRPDSSQLGTAVHSHSSQQEQANPASPSSKRSERRHSLSELQDSLLPATTKDLFARAADIMRRSNDMSGVMFMDASYAATGIPGSLPSDSGKRCKILGFATDEYSSLAGDVLPDDMTPHESNFKWVLEQYPRGYSLNCDGVDDGTWTENTTTSEQLPEFTSSVQPEHGLQTAVKDRAQHVIRVKTLIPNVKSALFLPLWDFERGRWFAGCFCWSTRSQRALHGRLDLPFLKAFGHSIMQQVARLDAMTTNQAKTTFMSSLSHELRTPLHGILGSAHLMRNSHLDSFQISMVNSITVCGRTLLETVEHLLDHAERPEPNQNYSSAVSYGENSISIACEKRNIETPPAETSDILKCNIGFVTEEVVETMIIGEAPFNIALDANDNGDTSVDPTSGHAIAKKRSRFIILDICDYESLGFRLSASSYGRVVMNLFGNALKFTDSGYVHISVRSEIHSESKGAIVLRISDSGVGMTPRFLEKAFEPFRKQNQHTSGTGVGLSVVKRILEDVGGQIDVTSQPSRGTNIVLRLPLERLTKEESHDIKINPLPAAMSGLKGRKTCILFAGSDPSDTPEKTLHKQTLQRYVEVLSATLSEVLKLDVYHTSIWDGSDDTEVVICPEVSFESLRIIQKNAAKAGRRCPAIVLVAMDILEAETLRSDARVTRTDSIIESVTQPCGPYKLSNVINTCLKQYDARNSSDNLSSSTNASQTSPKSPTGGLDEFGSTLGLCPSPLAIRTQSSSDFEEIAAAPAVQAQSPPKAVHSDIDSPNNPHVQQALIVDDNSINRKLLSAWMKRHKIPFKEAKDGQQALDTYKEAGGKFDVILMDISMPVMDGMTSTRLIREHEKEKELTPSHIIALTGLTSASAKLEAWTCGVDDFMTKPVDFKKLESLMEAGRGGEGTGFLKEQGSIKTEKTTTVA